MERTYGWVRLTALLLAAVMTLGMLAACGKAETPTAADAEPVSTEIASLPQEETTEAADVTEEAAPTEAQTTEAATEAVTEAPTEAPTETTTQASTEAEKKAPQTKEEIVNLFNESINAVKSDAKSVVSNYSLNSQTSDATLSNKVLQNIANKLISANMGYDKKKANVVYNGAAAIRDNFPVRGQNWSSHLTTSDVAKATCTEKDGVYTVTLYLNPDTTPNIMTGQGHAGKVFSIITKDQIVEGAGSLGMSVIQEDSIKLTFKDCRITAKIDADTGRIHDVNYYVDWTLSLTAMGIDVSVSFGAEDDFTVKW